MSTTTLAITEWPTEYLSPLQTLINNTICYENGPLAPDFAEYVIQTLGDSSMPTEERVTIIVDMMISSVMDLENEEEQRTAFRALLNPCIDCYESVLPQIKLYHEQLVQQQQIDQERKKQMETQKVEDAVKNATLALFYQQDDDHDEEAEYEAEIQASRGTASNAKHGSSSSSSSDKRTVHMNTKDFKARTSMYDNFLGELDTSGQAPDTTGLGRRAKRAAMKQHEDKKSFNGTPSKGSTTVTNDDGNSSSSDDGDTGVFLKNNNDTGAISSSPAVELLSTTGPRNKKNDRLVSIDYLDIKNDNHERMKQLENERKLKLQAEAQLTVNIEKEKAAAARAARELAMNNRNRPPQNTKG